MVHPDVLGPSFTHVPVEEVRNQGAAELGRRVADRLSRSRGRFWLHLDVDVLDEDVFPATDYLMPGGLTWDELGALMSPLASSTALVGASIGCYNPDKDPENRSGRALVDAIRGAFAG